MTTLPAIAVYLVLMFLACRFFAGGEHGQGDVSPVNVVLSLALLALAVWLIIGRFG